MAFDAPRRWTRRFRPLVTGVPFLVTVGLIAVLFLAYTLAGFLLVPRLITTYVPQYVQEQLKRQAEIGEVRLNPLLFKLEIKNFRLLEAEGRPLLGFDRLFVDFQVSSLFRRAWTFGRIELDGPRLDVIMGRDGRLNLADLLDSFPRGEPDPEPSAPRRLLLQHAVVRRGVLGFTDLSGRTPQTATVEPIDIELGNIATLPGRRGPYAISATLSGGGVVDWEGEVSLVPVRSTGHLGLRGFPLATAWRFVQDVVALAEPAGRLDAGVRYEFAYRQGAASLKVAELEVGVDGLVLTRRGDQAPLLTLDKVRVSGGQGDLITRDVTVPQVSVSRGRVAATVARDGTLDWQTVALERPEAATTPPPPPAPSSAPAAQPWRVSVEKVRVEEVALAFADRSRAAPIELGVGGLTVDLSARLESGPAGLAGTVDGVGVTLARIALREAGQTTASLTSLDRIALEGGRIDLGARQVAASRVAVAGGVSTVARAPDGSLAMAAMLEPADRGQPARSPAPAPARSAPAPQAKPWTVALGKLDVAGHRVAVTDRSVTPAFELGLDEIKVAVRDVRSDGKRPFPFDASFRVAQGGRVTSTGRVAPDGRAADATLTVTQLALRPVQPYITKNVAAQLRSGEVSTSGRFSYRAGRERAAITYTGAVDVDRLNVVEEGSGEPVVSWKSLHAEPVRFGLAPDRLQIDEVRLTELDGRIVIFQDKSLSLTKLMKPATTEPAATPPPAGAPASGARASSAPAAAPPAGAPAARDATPFPVIVERVRIDEGSMSFADLSLVLPFATRVHALGGVVAGLGSDAGSRASVTLDGRVDEFGQVKVEGALSAFQPKVFTDLAVIFRNVPMSTLSPYSATFAGRRIRSGTMDLDLQYKIERSALLGENKVLLRQLQLGERVESPGVTRLPLDLAIAILSDSEGRIDIALPVRGNVDHPEFSYGRLIWQALVSVVTRVVTSPFRALGGLFGGDAERLQSVTFEAGSDVVQPPEREKLKRVAEVLAKRPRLKLTVRGGYDVKLDGEAMRSRRVRQELAQRLGVTLRPGEDPGPVAYDQAKTQRALETLLSGRAGGKALEEFQSSYEKSSGKTAERVNPVLALVNRASPDRAFYEAMFRRLVELAPLTDADVAALGRRRGEATARALKESAGAEAARVDVGDTEAAGRAERNAVPTRLELGAVGA
jgi:uncharacterized protein involved in outer membrane biogenesis